MERFVVFLIVMIAVNVAGNIIAQALFPTYVSDGLGRRFAYRVVFVVSVGIALIAIAAISGAMGY